MNENTICAIATPSGSGAIAMVRLSGNKSIEAVGGVFFGKKKLQDKISHSLSFGEIRVGDELIDEVLVSVFRSPHSYTGEDMVEISCHASSYIQQRIVEVLLSQGIRLANPGEFTQRAYLNGKMDLSQAEAVADIINAQNLASHKVAMQQMRGGYSELLKSLRKELLTFASLIELELDFSEEDVEFADRTELYSLAEKLYNSIENLASSFRLGNVMKQGLPVAIVGKPNAGKSTLLNALLREDRAIVSEVEGTTRDAIEDVVTIDGITYRFIDTAGIRQTFDKVESIGIEKTWAKVEQAEIIILLIDSTKAVEENLGMIKELQASLEGKGKMLIVAINKIDAVEGNVDNYDGLPDLDSKVYISAKSTENLELLKKELRKHYESLQGVSSSSVIVSNLRHYELLKKSEVAVQRVLDGLQNDLPTDFVAQDLREALNFLGSITGEISTDDILGSIFHNFCIGK